MTIICWPGLYTNVSEHKMTWENTQRQQTFEKSDRNLHKCTRTLVLSDHQGNSFRTMCTDALLPKPLSYARTHSDSQFSFTFPSHCQQHLAQHTNVSALGKRQMRETEKNVELMRQRLGRRGRPLCLRNNHSQQDPQAWRNPQKTKRSKLTWYVVINV